MNHESVLREGVQQSLPELALIEGQELRERVIEAWAMALSETEYERIEDIPPSAVPRSPFMERGTQADHMRATAQLALGLAEGMERVFGNMEIDHDVVVAGALVHDVGKPYEFSTRNRSRWEEDPSAVGCPSVRHPVYGVHIALMAGLPESVVHIVGAHAREREGASVIPSLEAIIVQYADTAMWRILEGAGLVEAENS